MSKRFSARPSELMHIDDPYAAFCLDEACMYVMCRIEEDGKLPRAIEKLTEPQSNAQTVEIMKSTKGVLHIDYRRNGCRLSDAVDH
ncbi:MAG: hypothetical protein IJC18_05165 [Clostridia bacterium]|nr:hypothetical protein [Clostridia bacterium]MBQ9993457.1 hypothetical protein [Clostridia bacterium]